ncbi:MAG: hypothetical protein QXM46_01825 [Candidatus Hadarchaeales archaeon]
MGPLLLLLSLAGSWYLLLWWRVRSADRRGNLVQALRRAEEDLRRALEGRNGAGE